MQQSLFSFYLPFTWCTHLQCLFSQMTTRQAIDLERMCSFYADVTIDYSASQLKNKNKEDERFIESSN